MSGTGTAFNFTDALSAIRHIEAAKTPLAMFGTGDAERVYKQLARLCHPDVLAKESESVRKRGNDAFATLSHMYAQRNGKGTTSSPVLFGHWVVEQPIIGGDIANLYQVISAKSNQRAVLKIGRNAADNDLMDREVASLKKLQADARSNHYKRYIPTLFESFKASGRRAIIINPAEAGLKGGGIEPLMTFSDIIAFVGKLDIRHIVWMSNRLLAALGFVHKNGIVHGAVLPPHLMFGPASHDLLLVDWCYSVHADALSHIPAMVKDYRHWYPREVSRKEKPTPATDIYMWAMMVRECTDHIPARFKGLLDWCLADSARTRPQDAWEVQDKWGKLAQEEFGKPKYLKLSLPIA